MNARTGFFMGLALGLTFSLGFAAATWTTPTASAQRGGPRYEYRTINHGWDDGRWANEAGREGWELIGFEYGNPHKLLFERRL